MENTYCVYMHTLIQDGRKYIGITKHGLNPNLRWRNGHGYRGHSYFWNAVQKYGWDNFKHEIIFQGLTREHACLKEKALIKLFNTQDSKYGFNTTPGGDEGHWKNIPYDKLYHLYIEQNWTQLKCANYLGCCRTVIAHAIKNYNLVKSKDQVIKSQSNTFDINADELYQLYIEKNLTCQQCAEYFGCSKLTITLLVEKYDYHKSQHQKALSAKHSIKINKSEQIFNE